MKKRSLKNEKQSIGLFFMLFAINAVMYMTKSMFSAAMASIVEKGVMTKSDTGSINAIFWFVYALSQMFGGFTVDKYPASRLIIIGLVSGIISNFIIYINQSYWVIILVWSLNAALQFGFWPGIFKIVSCELAKTIRSKAILWLSLSFNIGWIISMLVATLVPKWQDNFIVSAIALAGILVTWVIVYGRAEKEMVYEEVEEVKDNAKLPEISMVKLLNISGIHVMLIISFLIDALTNGIKQSTPLLLMESYKDMSAAVVTRLGIIIIMFSSFGIFVVNQVRKRVTKNEVLASIMLMTVVVPVLVPTFFVGRLHFMVVLGFLSVAIVLFEGTYAFVNSFSAARFADYGRIGIVMGGLNGAAAVGTVFASYVFPRLSEIMEWRYITMIWCALSVVVILLACYIAKRWRSFIK